MFIGRTDVEAESPILRPPNVKSWLIWKDPDAGNLKRPWCWERLRVGGEGHDRGWGVWMVLPTQRTWVWVNSRSWWWTGRPGVLRFRGCKESDTTEWLNWTELMNTTAMNIVIYFLWWTYALISLPYRLRSGVAGSENRCNLYKSSKQLTFI